MTQMYFVSCSFIVVYIPWHFRACNQIRISNDAWTRILIKVNSNGWNIKSSDSARLYTRKQDVLIEDLKLQLLLNWKYFFCTHHSAAESASQVPFISCKNRFTFLSVLEINFYYLKTWTIFVSCKCDKLWHYKAVPFILKKQLSSPHSLWCLASCVNFHWSNNDKANQNLRLKPGKRKYIL